MWSGAAQHVPTALCAARTRRGARVGEGPLRRISDPIGSHASVTQPKLPASHQARTELREIQIDLRARQPRPVAFRPRGERRQCKRPPYVAVGASKPPPARRAARRAGAPPPPAMAAARAPRREFGSLRECARAAAAAAAACAARLPRAPPPRLRCGAPGVVIYVRPDPPQLQRARTCGTHPLPHAHPHPHPPQTSASAHSLDLRPPPTPPPPHPPPKGSTTPCTGGSTRAAARARRTPRARSSPRRSSWRVRPRPRRRRKPACTRLAARRPPTCRPAPPRRASGRAAPPRAGRERAGHGLRLRVGVAPPHRAQHARHVHVRAAAPLSLPPACPRAPRGRRAAPPRRRPAHPKPPQPVPPAPHPRAATRSCRSCATG